MKLGVSFCITCKGRLHHLQQTLPENLHRAANYPETEFVILDYDSPDGVGEWLKDNYSAEIESGKIVYARHSPAPHFHHAHAKNMAHRIAKGDVLCSLDADNIIGIGFSAYLNTLFERDPNQIVRIDGVGRYIARYTTETDRGMGGRISVHKSLFYAIGGYDEQMHGWGPEDKDFAARAVNFGARKTALSFLQLGTVIDHGDDERVKHATPESHAGARQRLQELLTLRSTPLAIQLINQLTAKKAPREAPRVYANTGGDFGCGIVSINYSDEPVILGPLAVSSEVTPVLATARSR